jgi:hypothetical protein
MSYEIVKQIGSERTSDLVRESHLVKLSTPALCRLNKSVELYEVDYVIVEALQIFEGVLAYEETHVVASDSNGTPQDAVLYQATRALTVPEAMFSIGEHNYTDSDMDWIDADPTNED